MHSVSRSTTSIEARFCNVYSIRTSMCQPAAHHILRQRAQATGGAVVTLQEGAKLVVSLPQYKATCQFMKHPDTLASR